MKLKQTHFFKKENINLFISQILKGFGQIMLQESRLTGILFIAGIFAGSIEMGITSLSAVIIATIFAHIMNFNKENINSGLYGFSAALVGVAISLFFHNSLLSWIALIVGSIIAAWLQDFFINKKIPAYTLPFVLVTWLSLLIIKNIDNSIIKISGEIINTTPIWTVGFISYGQVIFQGALISGILFFIGVLIKSPIAAIYGIVAALLASFISLYIGQPIINIEFGLFGFNAVLCGIAMAGNKISDILWALLATLLSLIVTFIFMKLGWVQLTFPFVISCMIFSYVKYSMNNQSTMDNEQ